MEIKKDYGASVLARLLNHSRSHKEDFQSLLIRYVAERFLYRLGRSKFKQNYILKGAYLLTVVIENQTYRTTKDIDFLKTGESDVDYILESLQEICAISYLEDAVEFDTSTISLQDIREQNAYKGWRAKIVAHIGKARVVLQIDIGLGDSVFPDPLPKVIPSLLALDSPIVESYPIETVIAEKMEAVITLSLLTSRMKDFYDLYIISLTFTLNYDDALKAVQQTFARRNSALPVEMPTVFTEKIYQDSLKQKQWKAFIRKLRNEYSELELADVIKQIAEFSFPFWNSEGSPPNRWIPDSGWS